MPPPRVLGPVICKVYHRSPVPGVGGPPSQTFGAFAVPGLFTYPGQNHQSSRAAGGSGELAQAHSFLLVPVNLPHPGELNQRSSVPGVGAPPSKIFGAFMVPVQLPSEGHHPQGPGVASVNGLARELPGGSRIAGLKHNLPTVRAPKLHRFLQEQHGAKLVTGRISCPGQTLQGLGVAGIGCLAGELFGAFAVSGALPHLGQGG